LILHFALFIQHCRVKSRSFIVLALLVVLLGGGAWFYYHWREHHEDRLILAAARRYHVEPALVKAVVWRESWFNPQVRGRHGELGLMQVTEIAANEWAEAEHLKSFQAEHLLNPATNAYAGAFYLGKLLRRYPQTDNPIPFALADYNAGRTHVLRWSKGAATTNSAAFLAAMDFPGTRQYILAIMKRRLHYLPDFPPGNGS
jgi:soluble lytic murein transglycosylase